MVPLVEERVEEGNEYVLQCRSSNEFLNMSAGIVQDGNAPFRKGHLIMASPTVGGGIEYLSSLTNIGLIPLLQ
jgi:hypothetical protein